MRKPLKSEMLPCLTTNDCYQFLFNRSYRFDDYSDVEAFAEKAEVDLMSFNDYYKRPPKHQYEVHEFQDDQAEGIAPRLTPYWIEKAKEERWVNQEEVTLSVEDDPLDEPYKNLEPAEPDEVEMHVNPAHYKMIPPSAYDKFPDGIEYFDLMTFVLAHHKPVHAHAIGQSLKYLLRAGKKDKLVQDLKKARWYLNYLIDEVLDKEDTQ